MIQKERRREREREKVGEKGEESGDRGIGGWEEKTEERKGGGGEVRMKRGVEDGREG